MSALISPNQYGTGDPSQCKKAKSIKKKYPDCKRSNEILSVYMWYDCERFYENVITTNEWLEQKKKQKKQKPNKKTKQKQSSKKDTEGITLPKFNFTINWDTVV